MLDASRPQDQAGYDRVTIALHWLTALLVIILFLLAEGWGMLPRGAAMRPTRHALQGLHISLGIVLTAVVVFRLVWRVRFGRALPPVDSHLPYWLAKAAHHLLYVLLVAQIVLGFLFRWAQGEEFTFFGLFPIPALFEADKPFARTLGGLHNIVGWTIILIALGHAAAALYHHHGLRDGTLRRMLPRRA